MGLPFHIVSGERGSWVGKFPQGLLAFILVLMVLAGCLPAAAAPVAEVDSLSLAQGREAMWKSAAVNGWGQLHNGERLKALLFSGTEVAIVVAALDRQREWRHWQDMREGSEDEVLAAQYGLKEDYYLRDRNKLLWWWLWAKLICVLDAYVSGSLSNFDANWGDDVTPLLAPLDPRSGAMGVQVRLPLR